MKQTKKLEGYGGKYLVREDGKVYRRNKSTGKFEPIAQSGDPPRVRLYYKGEVERPYVHKLLERMDF